MHVNGCSNACLEILDTYDASTYELHVTECMIFCTALQPCACVPETLLAQNVIRLLPCVFLPGCAEVNL